MNKAILMGRLTATPELKQTSSGISVTSFSLAVDRPYKTQEGEKITDFLSCVAWRNTAEFICKYFTKGQMIALEGEIQTRKYTDRDGNSRTAVEVVASQVYFAGGKRQTSADPLDTLDEKAEQLGVPEGFEAVPDDDIPF